MQTIGRPAAAIPFVAESAVPWLSDVEMRAVDEVMVGALGIELKVMMENAGRNLAVLARALLGGSAAGRVVTVLAGPGGNGGGGLVAARHLLGAGAAALIEASAGRRVLALDVPSGLELSSGVLHVPHVLAEATMTLAAPKTGLRGAATVGDLADISVPAAAFERIGRAYATPFAGSPLVRLVEA